MSDQQQDSTLKDQLENLNSHLVMIKSLKSSEAEDQYFNLLEKAKLVLGDLSPYMAKFYYEYGNFLLNKVQNNMDLFNPDAVPEAQGEDDMIEYDSAYEDQDQIPQIGGNQEKVQKSQQKQQIAAPNQQKTQNVVFQDGDVQITENLNEKSKNKIQEKNEQDEFVKQDNEEEQSDIQVAHDNLQVALNLYLKEQQKILKGEEALLTKDEVFKYILNIHNRLGDLYMIDERFQESIDEYYAVIKMTKGNDNPEMRRVASQAHYSIGNCLLHDNKENCEIQAIKEYIQSQYHLLKYIEEKENYDISKIQIPSLEKPKIDRFGYLYKPTDSDVVKDLKDVMSLLLDKIEDTVLQMQTRSRFEQEKAKMNQLRQNSGFKEVSKDVKVTNLGTFGNRKKTPQTVAQPSQISTSNKIQNIKHQQEENNSKVQNPQSEKKDRNS